MDIQTAPNRDDARACLAGGGEMGERTRSFDWSQNPVGAIETWPQSLKTAVSICLNSRFPIVLWWGPELRLIYNDAWRPALGSQKHPALGKPGRQVWPEIWHIIGPMLEGVLAKGEATWSENMLLLFDRHGYLEETYWTYSYSPILDDRNQVGGVFTAVTENTLRVIGERRLHTLRELAAHASLAKSAAQACRASLLTLAENPYDIPFAALYVVDEAGREAAFFGGAPLDGDPSRWPQTIALANPPSAPESIDALAASDAMAADCLEWPILQVALSGQGQIVEELPTRFGPLPRGPWPMDVRQAVVLPLHAAAQDRVAGVLVLGVNPCRALDDDHRSFLGLVAGHIATAVANARAYEEEKRRAEALAELDRAKTAFFSNVSHEFRTPLTLMLGPVEELLSREKSGLPNEAGQRLEIVYRNGLRLLRLVNALLDFSRIEAGRERASFRPTDLSALTADLASNFRSACERAGLRLVVDCPPLGEAVYVDRTMWEKIILNLLSNAFKFTFEGEIVVAVRLTGDAFEIVVSDTGTGIPAEEQPRLFERFHRIENARGRTHEGSGIGLALVQELVKLHRGSISVVSSTAARNAGLGNACSGTTFTILLPRGSSHLPADQIEASSPAHESSLADAYIEEAMRWLPDEAEAKESSVAAGSERQGGDGDDRPRVLVADDNADMRSYVSRLLAQRYRVVAAADGEAALEAARAAAATSAFDLILTDAMMPKLDGFGLLKALRADRRLADTPIVLLSARAGEESRVEGVSAGADDYLVKPFSASELLARVAAQLSLSRQRREAKAELERSERRFRQLADAMPQVVWIANSAGEVIYYNSRADRFAGVKRVADDRWSWEPAVHPDDLERTLAAWRSAVEDRRIYECDHRLRMDDGTYRWQLSRAIPVATDEPLETEIASEGKRAATLWFGTATDIEDLKAAQEALREADHRKDVFLATLAHELRNPLAPIRNGLQLFKLAADRPETLEPTRQLMERQLSQMVRLIDDLLDLSRISRGTIELKRRRLSLDSVVQSAVETSLPILEANGHDFLYEPWPQPIFVDGDETRLSQVLANLLNNSAKYTEPGGRVRLAVNVEGEEAVLRVTDNGVGIPKPMLPKVFEMFTQVDRSLEQAQGGLGIGLSIVKRLVEMHGGTIAADSEGDGRGSTFTVRLPIAASLRLAGENKGKPEKAAATKRRILVVDDNRDAATTLAMMLDLMGHHTRTAYDGLAALVVATEFLPELILLDIGMPKLNGHETAKRVRQEAWGRETMLVALTGWGQDDDKRKSHEAGFDRHLVKPIAPAALHDLLAALEARASAGVGAIQKS